MPLIYIIILLSVCLPTPLSTTLPSHSLIERISVHRSDNHWILEFICVQEKKQCLLEFVELPSGWVEFGGKIKVPLANMRRINQDKIILNVRDGTGSGSKEEIKLEVDMNKIMIISKKVLNAPESSPSAVSKVIQTHSSNPTNTFVLKGEQDLTWLQIKGIMPFLPTISFLDQIIVSGDKVFMSKVFQNILSDKSECQTKKQYLEEVSQRLDKHIVYNQKIVQKQERMKVKSSEELFALQQQHTKMKQQMEKMMEKGEQTNLNKEKQLKEKRQINMSRHYSLKMIASKYFEKLKQMKKESGGIESLQILKEEIQKQQKQIDSINKEIERLNQRKADLFKELERKRAKLEQNKGKESQNKEKIMNLQKKYQEYNKRSQSYRVFAEAASKELQTIKKQSSKWAQQMKSMKDKLSSLESELLTTQQFTQNPFIDEFITIISTLKNTKSKIEEVIRKCQSQMVEKQEEEEETSLLSSLVFTSYPNAEVSDGEQSQLPPRQQLHSLYPKLKKVNIFSMNWILKYGVPSTFAFNCQEKNPISGYGLIVAINKGSIRVKDEKGDVNALYLGSCSELKAEEENFVPQAGDVIEWEGNLVVSGIVNLFRARLFRDEQ